MLQGLIKRADELRSRFKVLESVRGTGYHDEDRDHVRPDRFIAPQKNGFPPASEHLVMFTDYNDEEMVYFAGEDAEKALKCLKDWLVENERTDLFAATGTNKKLIMKIIPRAKIVDGLLSIKLTDWNDVLSVFLEKKIGLQGRAAVDDNSTLPGQ